MFKLILFVLALLVVTDPAVAVNVVERGAHVAGDAAVLLFEQLEAELDERVEENLPASTTVTDDTSP